MELPPPIRLAQDLAPTLRGLDWGIGGSSLLWRLGLADAPRDLDLVTTAAHFPEMHRLISLKLGAASSPSHPTYRSRYFARFAPKGPIPVDLFADVQVETSNGVAEWAFQPANLGVRDNLPWMRAEDWLHLYQLFDRPAQVKALRDYLADVGSRGVDRPNTSRERTREE
jgi:hypothetical protein